MRICRTTICRLGFTLAAALLLCSQPTAQAQSLALTNGWQLQSAAQVADPGSVISQTSYPADGWYPATVPGTVLTTLINNGVYPEPLYGTNNYASLIPDGLCRTSYWYRNTFYLAPANAGNRVWLKFDGINYTASVWVNGSVVGNVQGAFTRGIFDITALAHAGGSNALAVLVDPEPNPGAPHQKTIAAGTGRNGGDTGRDGPTFLCSVGWDWIPTIRDRNTGIWQGVTISTSGPVIIQDPYVTSQLPLPDTNSAELTIRATLTNATAQVQTGQLGGAVGNITFQQNFSLAPFTVQTFTFAPTNVPSLHVLNPRLWWPNGYGPQNLYSLQLTATVAGAVSDVQTVNFGIRQMGYSVPGSANLALVVNGVPIIAKGGDWGIDEALKRIPADRLDAQVHLHQQANFTIIRNWVGQSTSEDFYNACDRYGLLVWDEFFQPNPSDGPNPTNTALYLANAREKILRFRNHPCIALWCGRNEGDPKPAALAQGLSNLLATLDPGRLYQPNSSAGRGVRSSGPYHWQPPEAYYFVDTPFKTELGSVSIPTLEAIQAMMPSNDWQTINDDWAEHDFCSGAQQGDQYPLILENRYGPFSSLADFVRKSQLANYEAFRALYEGRFAQLYQPVTGVITWMSNPAQPSFVWQLYSWDLEPNASLFGTRKACEPVHIMLNQSSGHWQIVNTTPQSLDGLSASVRLLNLDGSLQYAATNAVSAAADAATDLGAVAFPASLSAVHFAKLELRDRDNHLISDNFYWRGTFPDRLAALNSLPTVTLDLQAVWQTVLTNCVVNVTLSNPAPVVALMTHLQLRQATSGRRVLPVFYSDNYISLLPGESKTISIQAPATALNGDLPLLAVDGWNVTVARSASSGNVVGTIPDTAAQATNGVAPLVSNATRINCGGGKTGFLQFGSTYRGYSDDADFSGGKTASTAATISTDVSNAAPMDIYQTQRWGPCTYTIPSAGINLVRLHFAEANFNPGGRQFNVTINGTQVLTNFDIAAAGGKFNAVVRSFVVPPSHAGNVVIDFTVGAADQPEICGIEVIPLSSPTNLALYRPVTVSSVADNCPGSNAVDGNQSSRWSSAYSDPQWICVDLGSVHNISAVELNWEKAYGIAYQIQVSNDAVTWKTIYSTTHGAGGDEYLGGLSGRGRYVRMYGTQRATRYGYSLWEFAVYDVSLASHPLSATLVGGNQM